MPKAASSECGAGAAAGGLKFEQLRAHYDGIEGIEYVRRQVRSLPTN